MKICYIYRKKLPGRHSIENVFETISTAIESKGHEIININHDNSLYSTIKGILNTKADIYHITGDVHYLSLFLPRKKTILTIHDIGAFKNNKKTFKRYLYFFIWFFFPIHFSKKITTISDFSKDDLIKYTKVNPSKVSVIENPLCLELSYSPKIISSTPKILQIGTGSHKNLRNLILAAKNIECELIIVGKPTKDEIDLLSLHKIKSKIYFNITGEELIQIYNSIDILFFASFSEGFGLPILEAQTKGLPVITSNLSPMKEISGGHALLVNPHSIIDISRAIHKIVNSTQINNMILEGRNNAQKYNLEVIADKYLKLYSKL